MKLEKISLVDRAVQQLRRMVVEGELEPGQRLTEQELSDQMEVGRGTVRAALATLEAETLVLRRPYAGWAVQEIDAKTLRDTYLVRSALEELAARLVSESLDADARQRLSALQEAFERAEISEVPEERVRADLAFHVGIVRLSRNDLLVRQYESLSGRIEWLYRWSERNWPRRINLIEWHQPIVDAIFSGDGERAARSVRMHTERSVRDDVDDLSLQQRQLRGKSA